MEPQEGSKTRSKWGKPEAMPIPEQKSAYAKRPSQPADDEDYSSLLNERQRLLRKLKKAQMEKQSEFAEREKGFSTFISGANKDRVDAQQRKRQSEKKTAARSGSTEPLSARSRKTWKDQGIHFPVRESPASSVDVDAVPPADAPASSGPKRTRGWAKGEPVLIIGDDGEKKIIVPPSASEEIAQDSDGSEDAEGDAPPNVSMTYDERFEEYEEDEEGQMFNDDSVEFSRGSIAINESMRYSMQETDSSEGEGEGEDDELPEPEPEPEEESMIRDESPQPALRASSRARVSFVGGVEDRPSGAGGVNTVRLSRSEIAFLRQSLQDMKMSVSSPIPPEDQMEDAISRTPSISPIPSPAKPPKVPIVSTPEKESPKPQAIERVSSSRTGTPPPAPTTTSATALAAPEPSVAESMSADKLTISLFMSKLKVLDTKKQKYLLKVLEQLENAESADLSLDMLGVRSAAPSQPREPDHVLTLRLHSTWGHDRFIGLTEVEVLASDGRRITVGETQVQVRGVLMGNQHIMRLFNGKTKTVNEGNMWQIQMPTAMPVDIVVSVPRDQRPARIRVWNFNKSPADANRGVQDMELLVDGKSVWKGVTTKAPGTAVADYSTLISMNPEENAALEAQRAPPVVEHQDHSSPPPSASSLAAHMPETMRPLSARAQQPASTASSTPIVPPISLPPDPFAPRPSTSQRPPSVPSLGLSSAALVQPSVDRPLSARQNDPDLMPISARASTASGSRPSSRGAGDAPIWLNDAPKPSRKAPSIFESTTEPLLDSPPGTTTTSANLTAPVIFPRPGSASSRLPTAPTPSSPRIDLDAPSDLPKRPSSILGMNTLPLSKLPGTPAEDLPPSGRRSARARTGSISGTPPDLAQDLNPPPSSRGRDKLPASRVTSSLLPTGDAISARPLSSGGSGSTEMDQPSKRKSFPLMDEERDALSDFKVTHDKKQEEIQKKERSFRTTPSPTPMMPGDGSSLGRPSSSVARAVVDPSSSDEDDDLDTASPPVSIPVLPKGRNLTINILTTWGDPHYVGLTGLEMFDEHGTPIHVSDIKRQVRADPADINILPEYHNDPRTIDKIFDGINRTCDDVHMWLAPYTANRNHYIFIDFESTTTLSMIRFWNFNKSRIHSFRGARNVEVTLDGQFVFKGEIQKAPGTLVGAENSAECVLFTTDESVLAKIEEYDNSQQPAQSDEPTFVVRAERPRTAGTRSTMDFNPSTYFASAVPDVRPMTSASRPPPAPAPSQAPPLSARATPRASSATVVGVTMPEGMTPRRELRAFTGRRLRFEFLTTHGDAYYVGLTGLQVLDGDLNPVADLANVRVEAHPRDMNDIPGHFGDYRTLDKLTDGTNVTTDDRHMWLIPFTLFTNPHLIVDLGAQATIGGFRVWNYNKSYEDTVRGAKSIRVLLDDVLISPPDGFAIRKAPGHAHYDFGHTVRLCADPTKPVFDHPSSLLSPRIQEAYSKANQLQVSTHRTHNDILVQDYQTPLLPSGYVFKFVLLSTFGDPYYIGLNGVELFDALHNPIVLSEKNLQAVPRSVADLPEMRGDVRTLDKLIDGDNCTWNDEHMWLAPFTPGQPNYLYIMFDEPIAISMIRMWNYSKTPARGVEEIEVYADDVLIFKGFLRPAPPFTPAGVSDFMHSILFTNDTSVLTREKRNVYVRNTDQDVLFYNDNKLEAASASRHARQPAPGTQLVRPMTSVTGRH